VIPYSSHFRTSRMPRGFSRVGTSTLVGLTLAALASWLSTAPAQAATGACPGSTLSQPFLKWGDSHFYTLVAGGDFEGPTTGWTLSGGAQRVAGSEPYAITGTLGALSLALPAGASAQSPFVCTSEGERTLNFLERAESSTATLGVQFIYKTATGIETSAVKKQNPTNSWAPPQNTIHGGKEFVHAIVTNGTVQVAFRFVAVSGTSRVDDVFLDPRMR